MSTLNISHIVDTSVFYYYVDCFGRTHFDIVPRQTLVEGVRRFIFDTHADYAFEALVSIGFGSADQRAAVEEERRGTEEQREEQPYETAFIYEADEWLGTDAGIVAALEYDTARDAFVLPLREAWEKRDDLPISQEQFMELLVDRKYIEEV